MNITIIIPNSYFFLLQQQKMHKNRISKIIKTAIQTFLINKYSFAELYTLKMQQHVHLHVYPLHL